MAQVQPSDLPDAQFKEYIEKKVRNTIRKYGLCNRNDKVGVAVSGGKDSITVLYILKKLGYNVEGLTIDVVIGNYTKDNLKNMKIFCVEHEIPLKVISLREEFGMSLCFIKSILNAKGKKNYSSCMICGILKRYLINKYSKEQGYSCLATGHNLDDEAQAFIMNVFRNDVGLATRQGPVSGIGQSKMFVKRIKPLYLIKENEIIRYSKLMNFPVKYGICPCSKGAFRRIHKEMLDEFEEKYPNLKYNIVKFHERLIQPIKDENAGKEIHIDACELCGEPTANTICKACELFIELKKDPIKPKDSCSTGKCIPEELGDDKGLNDVCEL